MDPFIPIAVVCVFLGWLLGILSPAIQERIRSHYLTENIRKGFLTEISQLRESSADVVLIVESKLGNLNKELLVWHESMCGDRRLPPPLDQLKDISKRLQSADDNMFKATSLQMKMNSGAGLHLKTFDLPYVRSKLGSLELFTEQARQHLLDLLFRISTLNQQIEDSRFYYKMTFDTKLSEENHLSVSTQLIETYKSVSQQARLISDMCVSAHVDVSQRKQS
jgi:hypothetical protein